MMDVNKLNSGVVNLYKYQSDIGRLNGFLNQRVWLHPLSKFNDPFEGVFSLVSDPNTVKQGTRIFDHHYTFYKKHNNANLSPDEFSNLLKSTEFIKKLKEENKKLIKHIFAEHGAFCFASSSSNIPMWAHYARDHCGYCIIFELDFAYILTQIPTILGQEQAYRNAVLNGVEILSFYSKADEKIKWTFIKVLYSAAAPIIDLNKLMTLNEEFEIVSYVLRNSVGVKFDQWGYENEFRLIVNANSLSSGNQLVDLRHYAPFLKVTGMIMGAQMAEEDKSKCHSLCREFKVNLYQAKCSDFKYEISSNLVEAYSQSSFCVENIGSIKG